MHPYQTSELIVPVRIFEEREGEVLPGGKIFIRQSYSSGLEGGFDFGNPMEVSSYKREITFDEDDGTEGKNGFTLFVIRETLPGTGSETRERFREDAYGSSYRLLLHGESAGRVCPRAQDVAISFSTVSVEPFSRFVGNYEKIQPRLIRVIVRNPEGGLLDEVRLDREFFLAAGREIQSECVALGMGLDAGRVEEGGITYDTCRYDMTCAANQMPRMGKILPRTKIESQMGPGVHFQDY